MHLTHWCHCNYTTASSHSDSTHIDMSCITKYYVNDVVQTKANLSSFVLMVECALSRHGVQNYVMHHPFTVLFFSYGVS